MIQERAADHYKTFIAMPIRGGVDKRKQNRWSDRNAIGMIGFDLKRPFGFGDLPPHQLDYMACFVDMISEPVIDLIRKLKEEVADSAIIKDASVQSA